MTQSELEVQLKLTGYPVEYHSFDKSVTLPYITYLRVMDKNISSDFMVHGKFRYYQIELYTAVKDTAAEKKLEDILDTIDVNYTTSEAVIKNEVGEMYQVVYEITLIEKR